MWLVVCFGYTTKVLEIDAVLIRYLLECTAMKSDILLKAFLVMESNSR